MLLVAIAGWWPRLADPGAIALAGLAGQWGARVARERMLDSGPAVGRWSWRGDAIGTGDVVWDNDRQQGFLLLNGFRANDPAVTRYQLWIFDAARDARYPVDGGLFDVPAGRQSVVVPIKPKVPVSRPSAFAVTVEQPGGAVVSLREHVVAMAPVDG